LGKVRALSKRLSRFLREVLRSGEEDMDEKGFRDYCAKRKFGEKTSQLYIKHVKDFDEFLKKKCKKDLNDASSNDVKGFVARATKSLLRRLRSTAKRRQCSSLRKSMKLSNTFEETWRSKAE
jgi:site-specific recombinase XerD